MVYLDVGGLQREAVVMITGFQNNCEVSSCVFGDCYCWCIMGQSHNGKSGRFLVLCFRFLVERIGRGHDFCFFLDSGLS